MNELKTKSAYVFLSAAVVNFGFRPVSILEDPGADRGVNVKPKRAKEDSDEEKHSRARIAPGDTFLPDRFQTVGVIRNSDWCQKFFVFSAQSEVTNP